MIESGARAGGESFGDWQAARVVAQAEPFSG